MSRKPKKTTKKKKTTKNKESIKLDQIMRTLFEMSDKVLISTFNYFFKVNINPEDVIVTKNKGRFVTESLKSLEIDAYFSILDALDPTKILREVPEINLHNFDSNRQPIINISDKK
jgi:hypothetical protein